MLANSAVRSLIRDGKCHQLPNIIRTHREAGMGLLDHALVDLLFKQTITGDAVLDFCNERQEVEQLIGGIQYKIKR